MKQKYQSLSPDVLLLDKKLCASQGGHKRINYQKGGGGGAFKRKQGLVTGNPAASHTTWGAGSPGPDNPPSYGANEGRMYNISSYSKRADKGGEQLRVAATGGFAERKEENVSGNLSIRAHARTNSETTLARRAEPELKLEEQEEKTKK